MCRDQGQVHVAQEEALPAVRPDGASGSRREAIESDLVAFQAVDVSLLLYVSGLRLQPEPVGSIPSAVGMLHQSQRCTGYRRR